MIILGLTGSIAMGKSEAAKNFATLGIPVFDSDAEVHSQFKNNKNLVKKIEFSFPSAVMNGTVDRKVLGKLVFGNPEKTKQLEALIHPLVKAQQKAFIDAQREKKAPLVVLDIPLLFETGGDKNCDKTLVISAPKHVQEKRVLARPNMDAAKFNAILSHQMSDEEKRKKADFVIYSDKGLEVMKDDIKNLVDKLMTMKRDDA